MTKEDIDESISSGRLKLKFLYMMTHYTLPLVSLMFSLVGLLVIFTVDHDNADPSFTFYSSLTVGALLAITLGLFIWQRNKLRFKVIDSDFTRAEIEKLVEELAVESDWQPVLIDDRVIVMRTYPGVLSGSWGEMITVLYDNGKIYVNSICDPEQRSSVSSMGRNRDHINTILSYIEILTLTRQSEKTV